MDEAVARDALKALFRGAAPVAEIRELAGDASTRRYFRVRMDPGAPLTSVILMEYPDEIPPGEELPFVNVHRYLRKAGIPVPGIYLAVPEAKLLVLEDAGDTLLEDVVAAAAGADDFLPLYEMSVEILVRIQWDGTRALDGAAIPGRLDFDVAKFGEEIAFFFRHAVREYGGIPLSDAEEAAIGDRLRPFLEEQAGLPRVLAHRDYHSRNIMVLPDAASRKRRDVRILDFQDARMGSVFYDLCSLLRDSYVTLPEKIVDHLGYVFRHAAPPDLKRKAGDRAVFARRLDSAALQRNIKAIGTFGNQARNRGKTLYLRYIPPTVAHLRANFERNPEMRSLARRLGPILDELAGKAAAEAPR